MKRSMALALGMAMATATLSAQSGGGVATHVAILKAQAETIRSLVLRTAEKVPENLYAPRRPGGGAQSVVCGL